ncbi:hypothetical protein EV702DRAFT_329642 [Suillus placidus]|uniref:Uncharacterized protein n=1 Tax=Suillus placidus TaxID=48579 RepID=A0A9P6ZTU7_9AGAM|nr:hypothetical protein EV702DRAFT_329642 [Suillus placidus]
MQYSKSGAVDPVPRKCHYPLSTTNPKLRSLCVSILMTFVVHCVQLLMQDPTDPSTFPPPFSPAIPTTVLSSNHTARSQVFSPQSRRGQYSGFLEVSKLEIDVWKKEWHNAYLTVLRNLAKCSFRTPQNILSKPRATFVTCSSQTSWTRGVRSKHYRALLQFTHDGGHVLREELTRTLRSFSEEGG